MSSILIRPRDPPTSYNDNMTETTTPWQWYCRIDGAKGEFLTRQERDEAALKHRDEECSTADRLTQCWIESGHLVHVWSY